MELPSLHMRENANSGQGVEINEFSLQPRNMAKWPLLLRGSVLFFFPQERRLCKVSKPLPQKTEKLREEGICDRTSLPHFIKPGLRSAC